MNPILTKSYKAGATVSPYRIVKFGADDEHVVHAAAATDAMFGVSAELGADAEERVDVHVAGIAEVEYGGALSAGDLVTSDANGKAVAAAPAAGTNNRVIGIARVSGVAGDIGSVFLYPGQIQG